jgi:hypothetical protein
MAVVLGTMRRLVAGYRRAVMIAHVKTGMLGVSVQIHRPQ